MYTEKNFRLVTCYEPCRKGRISNFGVCPSPKVSKRSYSLIQCSVFFDECIFLFFTFLNIKPTICVVGHMY